MSQRKGGKQYDSGAGIGIISLIAFYAVLSGTENKRILQVKNEIYTFEMTEEEAAKAVFDYIYSDCDYDYDAKVISTMQQGEIVYLYKTQEKSDLQYGKLNIVQLFKRYYTSDGVQDPNLVDKQPGIYLLIVSLDEEASDEKE